MTGTSTTVLVAEDERDLADVFAAWLEPRYDVRTAYDGGSAITLVDSGIRPDVALLDRRMPDKTGDEVLAELRDRGIDCRVAMVTAVEPDFDVIGMGFDDYITKPVSKADIRGLVEQLLDLNEYDDYISRSFQLASKKAALESAKSEQELRQSDEYAELKRELEQTKSRADSMRDDAPIDELLVEFD